MTRPYHAPVLMEDVGGLPFNAHLAQCPKCSRIAIVAMHFGRHPDGASMLVPDKALCSGEGVVTEIRRA